MTTSTKKESGWKNQLISALVGLMGAFGGSAGTYKLMEYRLDLAEEEIASLKVQMKETGEEVMCLVCEVHEVQICPGCSR